MPGRRCGESHVRTVRRKHSLGNLRRAHPTSGATWNVQIVRGKMSSKCLWHACRALILGLSLLLLGAGMATVGYYADYLSESSELRGNATVRVKNDLKGFHLNNLSYVGPIVMGFGGFIVVASCVMTFEARDSAAKVVPTRLRVASNAKTVMHSNPSSGTSQRKTTGIQLQSSRWDQNFGIIRPSPVVETQQITSTPLDREALTAELIQFSKFLSATARFSPQLPHHTLTGSVPNVSTCTSNAYAYSTNISNLLSPRHKSLLLMEQKWFSRHLHHHHHHHYNQIYQYHQCYRLNTTVNPKNSKNNTNAKNRNNTNSGCQLKCHRGRVSTSLIQRQTRKSTSPKFCRLLQTPHGTNKLYYRGASFDDTAHSEKHVQRKAERTKRSNTSKKHVLARQKQVEEPEENKLLSSPLGKRRGSIMSDSSYSDFWATRGASIVSRASSIDSRCIRVDLHSPEIIPKSILRSPKLYNLEPSGTSSIEKEFRSQLSICSEPPTALRQLSGQSSLEPCLPEETTDIVLDECSQTINVKNKNVISTLSQKKNDSKKLQSDTLPFTITTTAISSHSITPPTILPKYSVLKRRHSSQTYYDRKKISKRMVQSHKTTKNQSLSQQDECKLFDSEQIINERRSTLLKCNSEAALTENKFSGNFLIPEGTLENCQHTTIEIDIENLPVPNKETILQIDFHKTVINNDNNASKEKFLRLKEC